MKCQACQVDLLIANREGVEIDYCPRCRGVWLDRGELDKIIERSTDDLRGREDEPDEPYESRRGDDERYGDRGRKRKSSWRDMFDFD